MPNELGLPGVVSGGRLLSTMVELRREVETKVQASPQRLKLAQAYLDSLAWGIKGLEEMGHRIGFTLLDKLPPQEFPKMLYREGETAVADNQSQEQSLNSEGFWPLRSVAPPEASPPVILAPPPIIEVRMPSHG